MQGTFPALSRLAGNKLRFDFEERLGALFYLAVFSNFSLHFGRSNGSSAKGQKKKPIQNQSSPGISRRSAIRLEKFPITALSPVMVR